ncbi:MAG: glycosyltransferase family 2 protein [Deltaproteobacteria bacterium]|nr:glycosyltransferase family 2 protein [Deltaproteobacteria bacterium]
MEKVSITITCYNEASYLPQAIESALSQDYPNLEVVVSDNASEDDTREVVGPFLGDSRVFYFRNETNLGFVRNYRRALYEHATGDYVLHLDGDDFLTDSRYIGDAMDLIRRHGLVMVFARARTFFENRNQYVEDKVNRNLPEVMDGNWLFLNYFKGYSIPLLTVVHDRRQAMKIGFYNKEGLLSSDWESALRLMLGRRVGFKNRFVGVWRRHGSNLSQTRELGILLSNTAYIESPYQFALKARCFPRPVLDKWRLRMLKRYFVSLLMRFTILRDETSRGRVLDHVKRHYGDVYRSLLRDPRYLGLRIVSKHRGMLVFLFREILKQESFLRDLEGIRDAP